MSFATLLRNTQKVKVEDLCLDFYTRRIFRDPTASESCHDVHLKSHLHTLATCDESFAATNVDIFACQMEAIKVEVFGLALAHRTLKHSLLLREIAYTKELLTKTFCSVMVTDGLWESMGVYNDAIASAAGMIPSGSARMGRARGVMVNTWKLELLTRWIDEGINGECAARVLNRVFAEKKWTEQTWPKLMTPRCLAAQCASRLGSDSRVNPKALCYLTGLIWSAYQDASTAIREFRLQ